MPCIFQIRRRTNGILTLLVVTSLSLISCATPVIPLPLEEEVDRTVNFDQLQGNLTAYQGRVVVLGGQILETRNLEEGTLFEILQLPLTGASRPVTDLVRSRGRFLLFHSGFLDTAVYRKGMFVTIVGEVIGTRTQPLGAMNYGYPYLTARFIHLWRTSSRMAPTHYPYPFFYPCGVPWPSPYPWDPFCYRRGHLPPHLHHIP